ncbi:hypothetical protein QR685DRAFT_112030 [Neurospora intermedia]|uniref:Uncharacterized protein n=1 Tax=Neurospora intermedia TaxID=5142 RepID=A0ABR3D141_NEUIN
MSSIKTSPITSILLLSTLYHFVSLTPSYLPPSFVCAPRALSEADMLMMKPVPATAPYPMATYDVIAFDLVGSSAHHDFAILAIRYANVSCAHWNCAEVPSILIPEIHPQFPPVAAHARGDILNASIIFSASATLDSPTRRTTLSSLGLDLIHVNGRLKADQIFLLLLHTFSQ